MNTNQNRVLDTDVAASDVEERLKREAAFHDVAAQGELRTDAVKYYAVCISSDDYYRRALHANVAGKRVLEYGCGTGSMAYELAGLGANIVGIDISPGSVEIAHRKSVGEGLDDRIEFRVMNAEQLDFPDSSFDVICGTGILHHLDLEKAYREILRVLRPGGFAVFTEPLGHNPLINMYRNRTPEIRTPDEHPLLASDLEMAGRIFPSVDFRYFHVLSLGATLFAKTPLFKPVYALSEFADRLLMKVIPPYRKLAWIVVLTMRK